MVYRVCLLLVCCASAARKIKQRSHVAPSDMASGAEASQESVAMPGQESSQESPQELPNRGNFSQECTPFPLQRVVLVTVNGDYVSFFLNWYHYAEPFLQATEHLYVVAENERAASDLEELQKTHSFTLIKKKKQEAAGSLAEVSAQAPYNSKSYGKVVMQRPREILDLLEQGCSVLYSDIDNVWVKDPFLDISAAGPGNLYLTDDGKTRTLNPYDSTMNYCTCFMYIHPHPATKQLMEAWSHGEGNKNQPPFNKALALVPADSGLEKVVLPVEKYPPGNLAKYNPDATVFHANYVVGEKGKVEFFEQRHLWQGAPSSEFSTPPEPCFMHRICAWLGLPC